MLRFFHESFARVAAYRNLRQYTESHPVSLWVRLMIEKLPVRRVIGTQLAGLTFVSAIIAPQAVSLYSSYQAQNTENIEYIDASTLTQSTYQWPLQKIGISQSYSSYHPALDLTSPYGAPVAPIAEGQVLSVGRNIWEDYGMHVIIGHERETSSLYAHLSKIFVSVGQRVNKGTVIGQVGSTGHSTGNHLHLEVMQKGNTINPLDALPTLPTPSARSTR